MSFSLIGKAVKVLKLPTVDYLNSPTKLIPVQQGDIQSRYFNIILYDDRGNIYLSIYSKAQLFGTVPSGLILTTKCEIAEDKKSVICQFGGGLTAQAGRIPCDIVLTNEDSTVSLTSQTFYAIVYPSQSANIVTENDETYSELLYLINEISTLEKDIHKAEAARAEAENGRVEAENNRESAFATAKSYCEEATNNANNAAQSVTDLLDALPCPTNKVDGEAVTPIANLQFVALED